jgi:hypothetical protein
MSNSDEKGLLISGILVYQLGHKGKIFAYFVYCTLTKRHFGERDQRYGDFFCYYPKSSQHIIFYNPDDCALNVTNTFETQGVCTADLDLYCRKQI